MLSPSSIKKSSSELVSASKNLVGGSCFSSPTIIALSPLAIAPTASLVVIWLASSKITISNFSFLGSKYWATDKGDIKKHGQSESITFIDESKSDLKLIPLPPLEIAFFKIINSFDNSLFSFALKKLETFFETLEATSSIVNLLYLLINWM